MLVSKFRKLALYILAFSIGYLTAPASAVAVTESGRAIDFAHGSVRLVLATPNLQNAQTSQIGVHFQLEDGWHIYGKEPGDLGLPTELQWKLPSTVQVEELPWPEPKRFEHDNLVSFGYEGEVLLPALLRLSKAAPAGKIELQLSWVLCREECRPGEATLSLDLSNPESLAKAYSPESFAMKGSAAPSDIVYSVSLGSLAVSMLFALLGGVILNLMPCVFPIISIKLLSFVNHGGESKMKIHGLVFGAGVLCSFWALAIILLSLRYFDHAVGWGFQFQSPIFVAVMAMFLFALGLSLAGVFEIGSGVQNWAGRFGGSTGYSESFLSGALATLLSTPCSAPFMGTAIAAALALPALHAFCIFTSLAIGMAAPYVILTFFPALQKRMPRPGQWMVTFKQAMSFPIFATVAWLMWVLGLQIGPTGLACFTFALLFMSIGFWIYGCWCSPHVAVAPRRVAAAVSCLFLLAAAYLGLPFSHASAGENYSKEHSTDAISWETFSNAALDKSLSQNRAVLVDFTAAWCLTCQVNHRMVYSSRTLAEKLKQKGVLTLRADWTSKNPEISRAIDRFGKSGVPLDVLFTSDGKHVVFPSILTEAGIHEALDRLL